MSDSAKARRIAVISMTISGVLAVMKITTGLLAGSTAVVADGIESAGDVVASGVVLFGLTMASRPADANHPYGHGRLETLSGFVVGMMLALAGAGIAMRSMQRVYEVHPAPQAYAAWALVISIVMKTALALWKFQFAKKTRSEGLRADAWNDAVDILSGTAALTALGLTLYEPARYLAADHFGGLAVGVIVIFLGLRVVRETSLQLMDTMPSERVMAQIREIAQSVPGAMGVEKCFARKTGLQYHVDLHLEVDPGLTVRQSHQIAHEVKQRLLEKLEWVADVLVHVEPHDGE
ncbi:MAG: cation transporter [Acidobacteria bacterium]|nr:cation transporter [Acidobacteriota bacterium]